MIITDQDSNYYNCRGMNRLKVKHIFLLIIFLFAAVSVCDLQGQTTKGKNPEKGLFGKHRKVKTKDAKVKEPRAVSKAKKTQAKKKAKLDKEYHNYVADSKKRAYKIQSPDVQARMKQNEKDVSTREKNHKKKTNASTKGAQKKYKK
jgi:hypothetical protein